MMRYLAHAVIYQGVVYRQSIVTIDGDSVSVARFNGETHSTTFFPGIIVVAPSERLTTVNVDQLKRIMNRSELIEDAIRLTSRYVRARNLLIADRETPRLILLPRT